MIAFAPNHVEGTEGRYDITQHAALDELRKAARYLKARRANADAIRRAASVGDQVVSELPVAALRVRVDFPLGNLRALHDELEVLNRGFDRGVDVAFFR